MYYNNSTQIVHRPNLIVQTIMNFHVGTKSDDRKQLISYNVLGSRDSTRHNIWVHTYVLHCSYEHQSGRESVIEQLSAIFTKFPEVSERWSVVHIYRVAMDVVYVYA